MAELTISIFSEEVEYDLSGFDCGETTLNTFLTDHLARQHRGRILRAYLLTTPDPKPKVVGYYTLSGSCFEKEALPSRTQQKKVPYTNVPSVTLGRLAIHKDLQCKEWGAILVAHAMKVTYLASQAVGIHGIFVDALNDKAKQFYLKLGFIALVGNNTHSLFYPTRAIEMLFADESI